jgi:glycerate 2-kinase
VPGFHLADVAEPVDAPGLGPGPFGGGGSSPLVRTVGAAMGASFRLHAMPHLVAAPDKFRGSASAAQVADAAVAAAQRAGWCAEAVPMADGGEGTLDALGGALRYAQVSGPLGGRVTAGWRMLGDGDALLTSLTGPADGPTAVIEAAQAAGRSLVPEPRGEDPVRANTFGVGELVLAAVAAGAGRIVVAVGGSATTDGGWGAVRAIGSKERLGGARLVVAYDVATRFGDAARVFGPQKGATPAQVAELGHRLERLADRYRAEHGVDVDALAGGGAAGGLAGGLAALGARLVPGAKLVAAMIGLERRVATADLVVTGEGRLDETSFEGKVVGEVVESVHARAPILCVVGDVEEPARRLAEEKGVEVLSLVRAVGDAAAWRDAPGAVADVLAARLVRAREA